MFKIFLLFPLTVIPATACLASSPDGLPEDRLRNDVFFLADSVQTGGRAFGSAASQSAISYVHRAFKNAGLWSRIQSFSYNGRTGHNVIAVTPGYFKKYIVVGAYLDGIGVIDGAHYPGADANASGVAVLLELARNFSSECRGDTGVMFVAFDGHGADLSGSRNFVERYVPERGVTMMINLNILGSTLSPVREDCPEYMIVLGGDRYADALENAVAGLDLSLSYDYYGSRRFTDLFYRSISDQKWFLRKNIPCLMFTSGITGDTNKTSDTPDRLDYPVMARRMQLISRWMKTLI